MKFFLFIFISCCAILTLQAQPTFVPITPSNKNVVLEEFTGRTCTWCPDGHKIAAQIASANPGKVFIINIHTGSFAPTSNPNYNTSFGPALMNQTGLTGFPAGTINRRVFSGGQTANGTALNRDRWNSASNTILGQSSYVNVAARSTIDIATRELTVNVEIYYTEDSPTPTNKLNVAILQNDILGSQVGMTLNPTQVIGNQYNHQHMLRHLLTGQWGEEITNTSQEDFVSRKYTYTIPAHLNNIPYELPDLEIIVFIAEGQQEIITGAKSSMVYLNGEPYMSKSLESKTYKCDKVRMEHIIRNMWTEQTITSLEFEYTYGETTYPFEWTGTIAAEGKATILSPDIPIVSGTPLPVTARLVSVNDEAVSGGGTSSIIFNKTVYEVSSDPVVFKFVTDRYASESSFKLFNDEGTSLQSEGPWSDLNANTTNERIFNLKVTNDGCYKLEVYDAFGDGINSGYGAGYLEILDAAGNRIAYNNGKFGSQADFYFDYTAPTSICCDFEISDFTIYPNPTNGTLHIVSSDRIESIVIYNIQGQQILQTDYLCEKMDVSTLSNGVYVLQAYGDKGVITRKFIKQ